MQRNYYLPESKIKTIAHKLAQGIENFHDYGIVIRNLNLTTIMMKDNSDQATPRINSL